MVELTENTIQADKFLSQVQSTQAGAVVVFLGTTREYTRNQRTLRLAYQAYSEMAERKLAELEVTAQRRWPIVKCAIVHRLGTVELGEASILVAVSTPHRRDAFEAAQWLMDTIKQDIPIWKQEHWADGTQQWVHPGVPDGVPPRTATEPASHTTSDRQ